MIEKREASQHTFETIVGQDLVKRFLLRAAASGRLPQALLFAGSGGVGKRSLAYALAKHLVTAHLEPGGPEALAAQGKVERDSHPDVYVVSPKSASGQILKDQVDGMHERAHYAPLEARVRIIIIAPVEAMNPVAANNLLKLLEEPPPALHVFLCGEHMHRVLPTIRSRCSLLRCPPVEFDVLTEWLMDAARCPERQAETAARLSGGRPGLAWDLLTGENREMRRRAGGELEFFEREGYPSIFRVGHNLLDIAGGTPEALSILMLWFRDLLIASITRDAGEEGEALRESLLINRDMMEEVVAAAEAHEPARLARALEIVVERLGDGARPFIDGDLLMEVLLTDLGIALKS